MVFTDGMSEYHPAEANFIDAMIDGVQRASAFATAMTGVVTVAVAGAGISARIAVDKLMEGTPANLLQNDTAPSSVTDEVVGAINDGALVGATMTMAGLAVLGGSLMVEGKREAARD